MVQDVRLLECQHGGSRGEGHHDGGDDGGDDGGYAVRGVLVDKEGI